MAARRDLILGLGALVAAPRPALAFENAALETLLPGDGGSERPVAGPTQAPWGPPGERLMAVAIARAPDDLVVAIVGAGEAGRPEIVAGPSNEGGLAIDPFWSVTLDFSRRNPLPPGLPVVAVELANGYISTGRSTSSVGLSLYLRRDDALLHIFDGFLAASHSYDTGRGRRSGWHRQWRIEAQPARSGAMPDLIVRDARTRAVASRHRWQGEGYLPRTFERIPDLGPG